MNKPTTTQEQLEEKIKEILRDGLYKAWYCGEREHNAHIYVPKIMDLFKQELTTVIETTRKETAMFTEEELEVMYVELKSLQDTNILFQKQITGTDNGVIDFMMDNERILQSVLKKLEPYKELSSMKEKAEKTKDKYLTESEK